MKSNSSKKEFTSDKERIKHSKEKNDYISFKKNVLQQNIKDHNPKSETYDKGIRQDIKSGHKTEAGGKNADSLRVNKHDKKDKKHPL